MVTNGGGWRPRLPTVQHENNGTTEYNVLGTASQKNKNLDVSNSRDIVVIAGSDSLTTTSGLEMNPCQ